MITLPYKQLQNLLIILASGFSLSACNDPSHREAITVEQASEFIQDAEKRLEITAIQTAQAAWIFSNFTTYDSEALYTKHNEQSLALDIEIATQAKRYEHLDLMQNEKRKLKLLKTNIELPTPNDRNKTAELAMISARMQSRYGKGQYCSSDKPSEQCLNINEMTSIMANSTDPQELLDVWQGWRTVSAPMRKDYQRFVELANEGAQNLGYQDLGVLWRSKYDMSAEDFAKDYDHQWTKVKPLYDALHCHVRAKLAEHYGGKLVQPGQAIPAHLLGNMWAQHWTNIYALVAPQEADPGYDLTQLIQKSNMTELDMVKTAERFFTSLGFDALPETFWQRSLFVKPKDRDVVCHASAWDLDHKDDIRIKMCIEKTAEDFNTIHHELGHNIYQRAYKHQPFLYRGSANSGFHEAIGDTIALSITPKYLVDIGLLEQEPAAKNDIGILLHQALDKVAFLPFALLIDKWRWQVFSGATRPEDYNKAWWALREQYQGIRAPIERSESDFDPGAKYHIPSNTSYARYFLAYIQQFQFHQALCNTAGYEGPLHRCTIYNSKAAGNQLADLLAMGKSQPWPAAMHVITGQTELDASAILSYFAPLKTWLDEQNKNRQCGW